jgi:hypothetical protein
MRSIALSCRARLWLEVLTERCLLSTYGLGHTVRVSHGDPFAGCTADLPQQDTLYPSTELETFLTVDPTNSDHLAAIWQQDRWASGGARGIEVGISFDGGQTWQDTPIPGLTPCTGGTSARTSDPWISFAANGDLLATSLGVTAQGAPGSGVSVSKSTDGGLTWLPPVLIPNSAGADKESITADPSDPSLAYVTWTNGFSRTTDGGRTWEPTRHLFGGGDGNQIVVLPDGTAVNSNGCEVFRSTDHGQNWGPSNLFFPNCNPQQVTDPNTHQPIRAGLGLGDIAVDPNSGALYVVIEDTGVAGGQHDGVAFSTSLDGGVHWSTPIKANQTPTNIPNLDQQAFLPTVQVAADGTVGVAYYDFRFNQSGPDLPTDYWFVPGTPDGAGGITWGQELRLTHKSFNFEDAPFSKYGKFVGDYEGRGSAGNDMLNLFGHPHGRHGDGIFFRRVINLGDGATAADNGDLDATTQDLGAVLRVDPAEVSSPATLAADQSATPSLAVALSVAPDLVGNSMEPSVTPLTANARELSHAAPAHSLDVTLPALLVNEGIQDILES